MCCRAVCRPSSSAIDAARSAGPRLGIHAALELARIKPAPTATPSEPRPPARSDRHNGQTVAPLVRRTRVYAPGGRTDAARLELHGTSQPNPSPRQERAAQTRPPSPRPRERRGLADLPRLTRRPIDRRGARRPRRARGVRLPPAAREAGRRRRGRGTRRARGIARAASTIVARLEPLAGGPKQREHERESEWGPVGSHSRFQRRASCPTRRPSRFAGTSATTTRLEEPPPRPS